MTTFGRPDLPLRFEQELRAFLEDEARLDRPDYLADILVRSVASQQRTAWTIPERWLPVSVSASRVAAPFRLPWRILAIAALLVVLAALAAALLVAGSRPRVPAPFGLAANGLIAYAAHGDIFAADPATGRTVALVTGTALDGAPVWSRDGLRLAFVRDNARLFVVGADGSDLREVTTKAGASNPRQQAFSPDGREIAFLDGADKDGRLWIAQTDGSGVRRIDVGMGVTQMLWRPPDGAEIIFTSAAPNGLYAVNARTGVVRTILAPAAGIGRDVPAVSPDGTRIAYSQSTDDPTRNTYVVHVVGADGSGDRALPMAPGATFQDLPVWSNDGTRLAVIRGYASHNEDVRVAIVPADGSGVGIETRAKLTGCCDNAMEWAPSDSAVLLLPEDLDGTFVSQILVDPTTGTTTTASWGATSLPTWERRAP
jgi:dipeptidyl aminopeptidase/acylaminoacyl peptidase